MFVLVQWDGGAEATSGSFTSTADIDFYVDVDPTTEDELVIVSDSVQSRHSADLLTRHIVKFEEIVRDLEAPPIKVAAAAAAVAGVPVAGGGY